MSQRIHLDATPGLFHQVLHCHQGDVGRQFEIAVVTRDGYEIPSGATFKIQATKPSGLGFTVTGTAANNIISFTSTEDMTSEAGEIPTQLEIKSGNDVIYTSNFLLVCEKNTHPASITDGSPEEIISEITLLVERAETAASTAGADAAAAAQARVDEMMDYLPSEVADLKSKIGNIKLADNPLDLFELGSIYMTASVFQYQNSTSRVRTLKDGSIKAYPNDVIGLTDYTDARFYVGWSNGDGTYSYRGWLTSDFVVEQESEYAILISNINETTQTDKTALASLFKFEAVAFDRINDNTSRLNELSLVNPLEYDGYITSNGSIYPSGEDSEKYTNAFMCKSGDSFRFSWSSETAHNLWLCYAVYDEDGEFIRRAAIRDTNTTIYSFNDSITVSDADAKYIRFTYRTYDDAALKIYSGYIHNGWNLLLEQLVDHFDDLGVLLPSITGEYPKFDSVNKKLTIPEDTLLLLKEKSGGNYAVQLSPDGQSAEVDFASAISSTSAIKIYFNYQTSNYVICGWNQEPPANSVLICSYRKHPQSNRVPAAAMSCPFFIDNKPFGIDMNDYVVTDKSEINKNIKSVNHRGYNTVAPENTLPAFKLSKKHGFSYVETDVSFTSDEVAVLLHDNTINRTARNADGTEISSTINISDITYEQALTYDFGIWMGSEYAGTKIPTFTQFIKLCRNLGLHPYIELKIATGATEQNICALVDIVEECGMKGKVTWISFSDRLLSYVRSYSPTERIGYIVNSVNSNSIEDASALKTAVNEVFIDSGSLTDNECVLCINADLPMEIWTVNNASTIINANPYVSGFTSDSLNAGLVLYEANI